MTQSFPFYPNLQCSGLRRKPRGNGDLPRRKLLASVDPSYAGFEYCECEHAYYWDPKESSCKDCPNPNIICSVAVNSTDHRVSRGYYPFYNDRLANGDELLLVDPLPCYNPYTCNPHSAVEFECGPGHDKVSLMCSRCSDGWYAMGQHCWKCQDYMSWLVPTLDALLLVLFFYYLWARHPGLSQDLLHRHHSGKDYATISIFIFYLQVRALVVAPSHQSVHSC